MQCAVRCIGCGSMLMKSAVLCENIKHDRKDLRRYSQRYIYFYESNRTEFSCSLQLIFQHRLRIFRWHCITG